MSTRTRDWHAWINVTLPSQLYHLHVIGEALVGNEGIEAFLMEKEPRGMTPSALPLDLHKSQRRGQWQQRTTWVRVRYEKTLAAGQKHGEVDIFEGGTSIAHLKVETVT
jgi:hypothetical protein